MSQLPYSSTPGIPYGGRVLVIPTIGGFAYIATPVRNVAGSKVLRRTTELGAPNGFVMLNIAKEGGATLQLATSAIPIPQPGHEFINPQDTLTYVITTVTQDEEAEKLGVVDMQCTQKI